MSPPATKGENSLSEPYMDAVTRHHRGAPQEHLASAASSQRSIQLDEADVLGVLAEALPAHVQPVFTDQAVAVGAHAAGPRSLPELPGDPRPVQGR